MARRMITTDFGDPEVKTFRQVIEEQPTIRIKVPKLHDREDTYVPVIINGLRFDVPIGESCEVPECVANVLENAGYI